MKIGYRTIKTAVGTPLSIWIAELLQLDNAVSAGILTILCTQITRKKSFLAAWHRIGACILAIILAFLTFEGIGFYPFSIGIFLIIFIPLTVRLGLSPGIVSSSVILLHLYQSQGITADLVVNELILIAVGIGTALLVNLYMPSLEANIQKKQQTLEANFSKILLEIAAYLKNGDQGWSGKEIKQTASILKDANQLVYRDVENHVLRSNHPYFDYFEMRTKQFEILERILPLVSRIPETSYDQCLRLAAFFEGLADSVHPGNTAQLFLEELEEIRDDFNHDPLPESREEFETRAHLLQLLKEMEDYLILKKQFKKSDIDRGMSQA